MPKVFVSPHVAYSVDDGLYRSFLHDMIENGANLEDAVAILDDEEIEFISDYVKYRLAEVDPAFAPEKKEG